MGHAWIKIFVYALEAYQAEVAELADARDSKSRAPRGHEGSTPSFGTNASLFSITYRQYLNIPIYLPIKKLAFIVLSRTLKDWNKCVVNRHRLGLYLNAHSGKFNHQQSPHIIMRIRTSALHIL